MKKLYVANAFVCLLFLGLIYAWSVFVAPLETEFGWTRSETSLNFSISMAMFCLGGIASGWLLKIKTPRQVMILSGICILAGFSLASRMQTLSELYFFHGFLCGFGVGVGYNVLVSTTLQWFPDRQGSVAGFLLMAFGMGGFLLGTVAHYMMEAMGWRNTFMLLGLVMGGLIFLVSLNVKRPAAGQVPRKPASESERDYKPGEMLRDRSFHANYMRSVMSTAVGFTLVGNAAPFAYLISQNAAFAALIGGLVSIFNGLGRVAGGIIFDKIGSRKTFFLGIGGMFLGTLLLIFAAIHNSVLLLTAGYVIGGFFYGNNVAGNSGFIGNVFGLRDYAVNMSIANTSLLFASFVGPYVSGILFTHTGDYVIPYMVLLGMCCVSFVANILIKKQYIPVANR